MIGVGVHSLCYRFSEFRLDRGNHLLWHAGLRVALTPKMFDLLLFMIENAGKVISHDDFFEHVWPNSSVGNAVLVQNIASLRRVLSISKNKAGLIQTIPKHGYRFNGTVEIDEALPSHEPRKTVAVLPLECTGQTHSQQEIMAVSIADALSQKLGRFKDITVRPFSSIMSMQPIRADGFETGQKLGADFVLSGQIRSTQNFLSIQLSLLHVLKKQSVWQETYRVTTDNLLSIEEKIAKQIIQLVTRVSTRQQVEILPTETQDASAYQNYLKGRFFWNRRSTQDLLKAIEYFKRSILHDPQFGLAYSGLCDSYVLLINYGVLDPSRVINKARTAAIKAKELNPEMSETHASMGYIRAAIDWNWRDGEEAFLSAIELNPNNITARHWLASLYVIMRENEKANAVLESAREVDPLSPVLGAAHAWNLSLMNKFPEAEAELEKVLELWPDFPPARLYMGRVRVMQGRYEDAVKEFQSAQGSFQSTYCHAEIAHAMILGGKQTQGKKILAEMLQRQEQKYVPPYALAMIYEALGDRENVSGWLTEALKEKSTSMFWFGVEPRFSAVRATDFGRELLRLSNHLPAAASAQLFTGKVAAL